jgi:hypothetical protein
VRSWEAELSRRWQARDTHQQNTPGWWEWLRTLGAASRRWRRRDQWLADEIADARTEAATAQRELDAAQQAVDLAQSIVDVAPPELAAAQRVLTDGVPKPEIHHEPLDAARRDVAQAEREIVTAERARDAAARQLATSQAELSALDGRLGQAAGTLGQHFPDASWWHDRQRRELTALWTDAEWNTARTELFLAALALHKAFLQHTAAQMRANLQAAMDLVGGDAPRNVDSGAALAAWQSLFFVVPVVSTTFASYARLFGHLGKEALGFPCGGRPPRPGLACVSSRTCPTAAPPRPRRRSWRRNGRATWRWCPCTGAPTGDMTSIPARSGSRTG